MYLHLGTDCMVRISEIIGIFNLTGQQAGTNEDYLTRYKKQAQIVNIAAEEKISSFVVTDENVYLSAISALTLKKRVHKGFYAKTVYQKVFNGGKNV